MQRRVTTILGAGAVLNFNFFGIEIPSTSNITKICTEQKVRGLNVPEIDLIKQIYDKIKYAVNSEYKRQHPDVRSYNFSPSFEDLFDVIETLYSYNNTWKHENIPTPLVSALVDPNIHFESIEYFRSLIAIIKVVVNIVNDYSSKFKINNSEMWYKQFWRKFNGQIDIFSFNYDTTLENSFEKFNDGFVKYAHNYDRFDPKVLWDSVKNVPTINHLHGCILYADINPKDLAFHYSHRDLYKFHNIKDSLLMLEHQLLPTN